MERAPRIADELQEGLPEISVWWRANAPAGDPDGDFERLAALIGKVTEVFIEFLRSPETVETFSRGGATHALVREISATQRRLGRDAVGVIEDYSVLRRAIWRTVERRIDLSAMDGGGVARFFVKLMQAWDWVTQTGLEAFEAIVQEEVDAALDRAATTDLLTGMPDRNYFDRRMLPRALGEHERFSIAIFDVAQFTDTVVAGEVRRARRILSKLADAVRSASPDDAVCARFGGDEVSVILPGMGSEEAYRVAENVLELISAEPEGFEVDVGVAEYPDHGSNAGELLDEALRALKMAKRVGGSGIVIAR